MRAASRPLPPILPLLVLFPLLAGPAPAAGQPSTAPCLTVLWEAGGEGGKVEAHRLRRPAPGAVAFTLDGSCHPACPAGRMITWTIAGPAGTVVRRGVGLDTLRHDFAVPGLYAVCVAEGAACGVPALTETSTHFTVEVGAAGR